MFVLYSYGWDFLLHQSGFDGDINVWPCTTWVELSVSHALIVIRVTYFCTIQLFGALITCISQGLNQLVNLSVTPMVHSDDGRLTCQPCSMTPFPSTLFHNERQEVTLSGVSVSISLFILIFFYFTTWLLCEQMDFNGNETN